MEFCTELLFPRRCPVCGEIVMPRGQLICPGCMGKLDAVRGPVCKKCGRQLSGGASLPEKADRRSPGETSAPEKADRRAAGETSAPEKANRWAPGGVPAPGVQREYCFGCAHHRRSFDGGMALLNYNAAAKTSMAAIKYRNRREYLDFYAAAADRRFAEQIARIRPDALIPVPVHRSRRRSRGYNQAEELAVRLGRRLQVPVEPRLLVRVKRTLPQRDLNPEERFRNLRDAFAISPAYAGAMPRTVVLVDDIYTTGSTAEACCRVLKQAGIEQVYVLVLCIGYER